MDIEKGVIFAIENVKQAITCEEFADAILIERFDIPLTDEIIDTVSIPVIASCRKGHFIEAKILEKMNVSIIDESIESDIGYMNKRDFSVPFICMVENEEDANKRIEEGAKFIRTPWGEIGNVMKLVKNIKNIPVIASLKFASPHDIAMIFQSGGYASIISSSVFHSPNPPKLLKSLSDASKYYNDIDKIFEITKEVGNILRSETNI